MQVVKAQHAAGKRDESNMTEPDVHIFGDGAWIAYVNKGSITDSSGTVMQEWLESAFLQKTGRHLEDRLHAQRTCLHAASPSTVMAYARLLAHPRIAVFCSTPTAPEVTSPASSSRIFTMTTDLDSRLCEREQ
jgi:hypothetical protein